MSNTPLHSGMRLVPIDPPAAVLPFLTNYESLFGLDDETKAIIWDRARRQWSAMLTAAQGPMFPGIASEVCAELARATVKFPTWPTDPLHALAVLGEEFGELNKAMLQLTYEPHKTSAAEVRSEAIQTAAMALRLAMSLDRYQYARSEQHSQSGSLA